MPSIYDLASNYDLGGEPGIRLPVAEAPIVAAAPVAAAPVAMPSAIPAQEGANPQLLSLLGRYFPQGDEYGPELKAARKAAAAHPIEETGARLRAMMPWIAKNKLVDKAKN